jgi:hypothetical protein
VGLAVCLWIDDYTDGRVVLTSSTYEHVTSVLFAEVSRWYNQMAFPTEGTRLQAEGIACNEDRYVVCVNPFQSESFSGRHGRHTLFVFDEATGIPDERFDLADTQATTFVALANPRTLSGRFRLAFSICRDANRNETVLAPYGYRRCLTVDGANVVNVRRCRLEHPVAPVGGVHIGGHPYQHGERISEDDYSCAAPIIPGQLCYDTYLAHCRNPDRRWVNVFAHGKFPDEDPQIQVILSSWLDGHVQAWLNSKPPVTAFALDVADSEYGDETIFVAGGAQGCRDIDNRRKQGLMETCAWVLDTARVKYGVDLTRGEHTIAIDAGGLGRGLVSRMQEIGVRVLPVEGGESPEDKARFVNRRAELYGVLGDRLNPGGTYANVPWALPTDSLLRQDLCAPEKIYDSDGFRYKITPKTRQKGMPENRPTLHEKLGRSPDRGDAVALLYWAIHRGATAPVTSVSRYQIATAKRLDGPADETNRAANAVVSAVYEDQRYRTASLCVIGIVGPEASFLVLRSEAWVGQPMESLAQHIYDACKLHKVWGIGLFPAHSRALAQQLVDMGAPVHGTALGNNERKRIASAVVNGFRMGAVQLYPCQDLEDQIVRLPIEEKVDGPMLGDPAADALPIERGMAFALAMYWAQGTLTSLQRGGGT